MSPNNKKKLLILRKKLDKVDDRLLSVLKIRSNYVKEVLSLKKYKKEIIDRKRIKLILKNIRRKSIKRFSTLLDLKNLCSFRKIYSKRRERKII